MSDTFGVAICVVQSEAEFTSQSHTCTHAHTHTHIDDTRLSKRACPMPPFTWFLTPRSFFVLSLSRSQCMHALLLMPLLMYVRSADLPCVWLIDKRIVINHFLKQQLNQLAVQVVRNLFHYHTLKVHSMMNSSEVWRDFDANFDLTLPISQFVNTDRALSSF